jgi:outer membrane protein OmpA-like peptidoglycan-associated protein
MLYNALKCSIIFVFVLYSGNSFAQTPDSIRIAYSSEAQNVGMAINSRYSEAHPLISPDGQTLYFNRGGHPQNLGGKGKEDVWFAKKLPDGTWGEAQNLGAPVNSDWNNFICGITPDGNTILIGGVYEAPKYSILGLPIEQPDKLYLVHRNKQGWGKPQELQIDDYYNLDTSNTFHLAADRKTILLALVRQDSKPYHDLYVSFLQETGRWSKPKNLGNTINTRYTEYAPILAPDGKTLYFASEGHKGYGSTDIFVTKRLDDSWVNWTKPQNLGPKVNSSAFDSYYSVAADGEHAYFASSKKSYGSYDIFSIQLEQEQKPDAVALIKGKVLDQDTKRPVQADINYEISGSGKNIGMATSTPETGNYQIVLPTGNDYTFYATADKYYSLSENIEASNINAYTEIIQNITLVPVKVGATVTIKNVFFDANKAYIKPKSGPALDKLLHFLRHDSKVTIEISGHTNNLCNEDYCKELSQKRAEAVKQYFVDRGIDSQRISAIGYGSTLPIATNETVQGRKQNQRVAFRITSTGQ